ncbi:MAG: ClpXP protease specificity-enhancing factor SspB [Acidiferrobacterales bacterium]|nr:ClpXP protease specificity-enhancing factor SspB [Acidiferrobacterales bacterium]
MTSIKPFLIGAIREWAVENGLTPQLIVDASLPDVKVPASFVENGRIVLNIHPRAVHGYTIDGELLLFSARFSRRSHALEVPMAAVRAVYARENGQGVAFPDGTSDDQNLSGPEPTDPGPPRKGPHLKIVK